MPRSVTKPFYATDRRFCSFDLRRKHARSRHLNGFARRLAGPLANAYPRPMCRHITKEQHIEGWRAVMELLPKLRPGALGGMAGALMARLHRGLYATARHRS